MTQPTRMHRGEFIALCAMMFATIAFSVDSMLPALPEIGTELSPDAPNRAQLILTSFVLGMGLGTFFTGPLSDAFGRKPVIYAGAALYMLASAVAFLSQSLEVVLAARVVQGIGIAGPRVVTMAIIRDLYSGREMARIMSLAMLIFTLVPAIAPALGAVVIALAGWRAIFVSFILFAALIVLWLGLRLAEPLPVERRRPLRLDAMASALRELVTNPSIVISIAVQTLTFAMLFTMLSMVQPVYDITFGKGDSFPVWFGFVAIVAGSSSLLNAALVIRLGMRFLVTVTLMVQTFLSLSMVVLMLAGLGGPLMFACFVIWQVSVFFQAGMTIGNLNAIAMEPVGHIAGMAASLMGAVSTVFAAILAAPVGLAFDGTPMPLAIAIAAEAALGVALMRWMKRIEERTE